MFKNVSLRPRTVDGRPTWVLLGVDGSPMPAFSAYAHSLRSAAPNTLDSYCRHVAEFVDYLIEVSSVHGGSVTKMQLVEAIEAYGDYLQMGINADKHCVCCSRGTAAWRECGSQSIAQEGRCAALLEAL